MRVYKNFVMVGSVYKETTETKRVTCDAWYLFGKLLVYQRINING